jgi:hypothetical protein
MTYCSHNWASLFIRAAVAIAAFACVFCGTSASASGTDLYFRTTANSFSPGSEFALGVFINSADPVNAVDIEVGYSAASLELLSVNSADSIVAIWKDSPETLSAGIVRLRGAILPSFTGSAGELVRLMFRVRPDAATGTLQWSFRKGDVYRADGKGTLSTTAVTPLILPISLSAPSVSVPVGTDTVPPGLLSVRATKNPIDGAYFAVWNAHDSDSGVRGSFIRTRTWFISEPWQSAVNPVRLPQGTWSFEIKVTDNQGNSAYRRLYIWPIALQKALTMLALSLVVFGVTLLFWKRRHKRMV